MRGIALVLCLMVATVASAASFNDLANNEWNAFKLKYNKTYANEVEEKYRMKIFEENKQKIAKHNERYELGQVSFTLAINKYADMLHQELVQTMNGYNRHTTSQERVKGSEIRGAKFIPPAHVTFPDSVDWRTKGAVTEVKDQAQCGSCWAFSSTGALEGQQFRKSGVLVSLSEQNLIDCSRSYGNDGCGGGWMDYSYTYIKENHGIDTESSYPYEANDDKGCRYNKSNIGANDVGFVMITSGDEKELMKAVATVGPVSVAIDDSPDSFQFYHKGVFYDKNCSSHHLGHAVLVVGYGTTKEGLDYWLVKNSWAISWGDEGYIKMARNRKNACGIATKALYPLV